MVHTVASLILADEGVVLFVADQCLLQVVGANLENLQVVLEVVDAAELQKPLEGLQVQSQLNLTSANQYRLVGEYRQLL